MDIDSLTKRDGLKPLSEILSPDIRHSSFVSIDTETGETHNRSLESHYANIERYSLIEEVPEAIATQFDVARNIYVYGWFEYRFLNVAEAKVLTVLELAIRERVGDKALKSYIKQRKKDYRDATGKGLHLSSGLKTLIEYCKDQNLVRNQEFTAWQTHATQKAYREAKWAQFEWANAEMERTGKTEISVPVIEVEQLEPDETYDHIQHLIDHTNKVRNMYAHGSTSLYDPGTYSFEMVSEFINQLYDSE